MKWWSEVRAVLTVAVLVMSATSMGADPLACVRDPSDGSYICVSAPGA